MKREATGMTSIIDTAASNTDVVKAFFAATYAAEYDRAFADYARPEFTWTVSSADERLRAAIPWAGYPHVGRDGYINLTKMLFSEFEPLSFETERYFDAGDAVFAQGHFVFRHRVTGKIAETDWLARFDMRDRRIAGGQFYENTYAVATARS
jgi:ketosteroid isomerase-like protein